MASFQLRLPDELLKELRELANKEKRSINGQILYILTFYLDQLKKEEKQKQD